MVLGHANSLVGIDTVSTQPVITLQTIGSGWVRLAASTFLLLALPIVRGRGILADKDVFD